MKKVRFIPLILALSLPLAGCSFEDLMFWKKKDTPSQVDKTVTEITGVHAPQTIEQGATLSESQVTLDVKYSDSSSGSVTAERVSLDTSSLGQKTGTAFYGQFFKDFTIEVVAPAVKTITKITKVNAPETIEQDATLIAENVMLDVDYSDGTSGSVPASRIILSTAALGEATGTAFVGNVFKDFTITVVAKTPTGVYATEILSVSAPNYIYQGKTLFTTQVVLTLKLSNGTTGEDYPDSIDLVTTTPGAAITGTVHYGDLTKTFQIEVKANVVESIKAVHAPSSIGQGEQLLPSSVTVDVVYSDGSVSTFNATSVNLDTSSPGQSIEGTAFYGSLSKPFSIDVIDQGDSKSFTELKNDILTNHNYTLDVVCYYENFSQEERFEGQYYALNDEVFYGTDKYYPNVFKSGYTRVKDQGVAKFVRGLNSDEVVIENFIVTNPELTISDIHSYLVEFILESELTQESATHYSSSEEMNAVMVAQYTNISIDYLSSPDHIDIYKYGDTIEIKGVFTANYYDEQTLTPVQNEPYCISLTIKNIGSTEDQVMEEFASSADSKKADPTTWDEEILESFADYYNGYVPPFIEGLSYSFHSSADWYGLEQKYKIVGEDYASGDKRSSYSSALLGAGYNSLGSDIYEKRVSNEGGTIDQVYRVSMSYISPSTIYSGTTTYGYYFVGGIFHVEFTTYTEVTAEVGDITSLNAYLANTDAKDRIPSFPTSFGSTQVTGFSDKTAVNNQLYGGGFIFATSLTTYFKIKVANYAQAVSFYNEFKTAAAAKGYTTVEHNPVTSIVSLTDATQSYFEISDMDSISSSNYPGYLQCRIIIREYHETFNVDFEKDAGVGSIHYLSPSNFYDVEAGEKVTFSFDVKDGYAFEESGLTSNVDGLVFTKESGTNTYSFIMPNKNVTVSIATKSSAAEEGLDYSHDYIAWVGLVDNSPVQYESEPSGVLHSKLIFRFSENGKMTYTQIRYNLSGNVTGTYTQTCKFTLIDGAFRFDFDSGDGASSFQSWRLVDSDHYNVGTFTNNEIKVTFTDYHGNETEVKLK